ncbi:hypothetical protein [Streptomyces sp. NBC_01361]|uniref:hypothetical protein n=1 Tax=Streptomyces sp. NBC_01361 TaxID=2903838 RepID=UPI002E2F4116|nr:hypothetical protein [Streptomyces sp. NBC_01361]
MPQFRPPEWQQPAHRHSEIVDPVLTVRQLSRFEFSRRTHARMDHALVFTSPKGSYDTYLPPLRPSRSEVAAKRYTSVYEVDMGVHPYSTELALPSDNDAFEFGATVELSWQVADPARFVASGHRDVPALVVAELQQAARPVTRHHAVGDSAAAETEMLRALAATGPLGLAAGIQAAWTVRLRRDQENIDHQIRIQAIKHSAAEQIAAQEQGMAVDMAQDLRNRQQDMLQLSRATAFGEQQQELAKRQLEWAHEQAVIQGRQQLELQKIETEKINFYQWHLQQGGVQTWALHLAQHPEDSRLVMESMREDQLRLIQAQMDLVSQLLSGDNAEMHQLEGPKQLALRTVSDILNQRLPGVPQNPPPARPRPSSAVLPEQQGQAEPDGQGPMPSGFVEDAADGSHPAPESAPQQQGHPYGPPPVQTPSPTTAYTPPPVGSPSRPAPPTMPSPAPPWQPPPGYGSSPTLPGTPPQPLAAPPATPTGTDQVPPPPVENPDTPDTPS